MQGDFKACAFSYIYLYSCGVFCRGMTRIISCRQRGDQNSYGLRGYQTGHHTQLAPHPTAKMITSCKGHHTPHLRQSATLSAILTRSLTVALTPHIPDNILCKIVHLHRPRSLGGSVMVPIQHNRSLPRVADEVYGGLKI